MSGGRIVEMMRKEFRQSFREPRLRALLVGPPIIQFLVFGFVVNLDVERSRLAWLDQDQTAASRQLRDAFLGSGRYQLTAVADTQRQLQKVLDQGLVDSAVVVRRGFARDLVRGKQSAVQVLVDGTNSNTASILSAYAGEIVRSFAAERLADLQNQKRLARGGELARLSAPGIEMQQRVWFNPELKSRNYFIPGILVNIMTLVTLMLTSLAIVREKEIGTMEQLMVTPLEPVELMLGKTLPFALVALFDLGLIIVLSLVVFRIPFQGSAVLLFGSAILFLFTTLGFGLFISTISHTQQQAIMTTFFFFQPAFMLSGFAFPIRNMPEPVQYLTLLNPNRYFLEICRGVFLKGSSVDTLWPQMVLLGVFGVSILFFSARRFHKTLD
ncbi:MAG: ABC transporter permease [Bryobacteraceae bacterium]|nr:ABC transporter permease [Bryobacteraceae bacterium]MDW8379234.1 ABC transporter permease [Bryobacterales bacterium]